MKIKIVAHAPISCRDDERLCVYDKADMTDEAFIKDFVGSGAIVDSTMRLANHTGARAGCMGFRHLEESPGNREE